MPRKVRRELLKAWPEQASEAPQHQVNDPDPKLIDEALQSFAAAGIAYPGDLASKLLREAAAFAANRSVQHMYGLTGTQRQVLKQIANKGSIQQLLPALFPEYVATLGSYLSPADADWLLVRREVPADVAIRIRRAANKFLQDHQPKLGRQTDIDLEEAVRAMGALLQPLIGRELRVAANKNNGLSGPTPGCAGAAVIDAVLRGIDPVLTTTAVMNMIVKVRNPIPSQHPLDALIEADPTNALDASLLPNRAMDLIARQNDPFNGFD